MFFAKKNKQNNPKAFVTVLGTSPLALFLTYVLQQNNVEVVNLNTSRETLKSEGYTFKNDFQSQNFYFNSCSFLEKKPEYCFLASSFDEYKNDILALSDNMLKGVPVVNFSSFYNDELIKHIKGIKEIRAYFKGWFVKGKKEIEMLNRIGEIILCADENIEKSLKEMLLCKRTDIKLEKNTKKIFLQTLIPYVLGNLLILAYCDDISKLLLNGNLRQKLDDIIKETIQLLIKDAQQIDKHAILPEIYAFPDNYVSEFDSKQGVFVLSQIIKGADYFKTPGLSELINTAMKKY